MGVGVSEGVGVDDSVGDGVKVGVGVSVGVEVGVSLGVGVGDSVGVNEGVTVGDAITGSIADEEFCGSEADLNAKSLSLLSVSSPFPPAGFVSPGFLSILPSSPGLVENGVPSESNGIPKPTLSTIVTPASLNKLTVLLLVIALVVAEYVKSSATTPS